MRCVRERADAAALVLRQSHEYFTDHVSQAVADGPHQCLTRGGSARRARCGRRRLRCSMRHCCELSALSQSSLLEARAVGALHLQYASTCTILLVRESLYLFSVQYVKAVLEHVLLVEKRVGHARVQPAAAGGTAAMQAPLAEQQVPYVCSTGDTQQAKGCSSSTFGSRMYRHRLTTLQSRSLWCL
jgi:hypothetical protein